MALFRQPKTTETRLVLHPMRARSYAAAQVNRLTEDWLAPQTTGDAELYTTLARMRGRARESERNNEFMRGWLRLMDAYVLGHAGIGFQSKIKDPNGLYDVFANNAVEESWHRWGEAENLTPGGLLNWVEFQRMALRRVAVDGSVLIHKLRRAEAPFGFQVQLIEIDRLDEQYFAASTQVPGASVRFGIERDSYGKPLAYWIRDNDPGDVFVAPNISPRRRVPAADIIHLFRPDRISQSTGAPWCAAVMVALENLAQYCESELYAARGGACNMGFFTQQNADGFKGDGVDAQGGTVIDAAPMTFHNLPPGVDFKQFAAMHPTTAFADFVKGQIRKVSSGLPCCTYSMLASDYENVNFSAGRLEDAGFKEDCKIIQEWLVTHLVLPVWKEWLPSALLTNQITLGGSVLPFSKLAKFNKPEFRGRGWGYYDPEKDIAAYKEAMRLGLTSRREVIALRGGDEEDVLADIKAGMQQAKAEGVVLPEEIARVELSKLKLDAYGVGVRAGCVTPNLDDETDLRADTELPKPSAEVVKSWVVDGGSRKPITLQSGKVATPNPAAPNSNNQPQAQL